VTNVDAVELRDLKWAVVHVARSKDTRLLSILKAISMTKDRIDDRDPVEIADDFIDDVDRTLNPLGQPHARGVCTENLIRVDDVMESPMLAE
jgi:hypothetical protein